MLQNLCFEVSDLYNESCILSNKEYPRRLSLYLLFFSNVREINQLLNYSQIGENMVSFSR